MTNSEKFKTVEERHKAFRQFCNNLSCLNCPLLGNGDAYSKCCFDWLNLEYKEALLPCPFCGGTPVMANNMESMKSLSFYVKCACGARFASALSVSAAADMWNRRVK